MELVMLLYSGILGNCKISNMTMKVLNLIYDEDELFKYHYYKNHLFEI